MVAAAGAGYIASVEDARQERRSLLAPEVPRWPADRPAVSLAGVRKAYGDLEVLRGVDLVAPTGRTTVVIGRSGSGKTVLLKVMAGLLRADAGEARLLGDDLTTLSDVRRTMLQRRVAVVFQNYALFDSMTVAENVAFPLRVGSRLSDPEIRDRVGELLDLLKIADAAGRMPAEISGGMRKRASFARAVVTQPEVVFFDEPTTGLDPVMTARVDDLIRQTQERYDITSVVISHDMASVFRLADHIAVLSEGRIVESGPAGDVRRSPDPTVRAFLGATGGWAAGPAAAEGVEPAVDFADVRKSFGDNPVLRGVTFHARPGEITVVIGASGSGKSVIIKHILGLLRPDSGTLRVFGVDMATASQADLHGIRRDVGMVFQQAALLDGLTVEENVALPLVERRGPGRVSGRDIAARVAALLERLGLADIARRRPGEVGAGHRKRVALARALLPGPRLMIYDEPTTGQDPVMRRTVDDMIVEANREFGVTSVVISHDMESTFRTAHRIAMLHEGRILAFGPPDALRRSPEAEVRRFIEAGAT